VGSVAFAWYSFYVPSNSIAWAQDFTVAQEQAGDTGKPILLFFTAEW
jgi:protein disulfide-isomerase